MREECLQEVCVGFGFDAGICVCAEDVFDAAPTEEYLTEVSVRERCVDFASVQSCRVGHLVTDAVAEPDADVASAEMDGYLTVETCVWGFCQPAVECWCEFVDKTRQVWDSYVPGVGVVGLGSECAVVEDVCGMVRLQLGLDLLYRSFGIGMVVAFFASASCEFSEQCSHGQSPVLGLRHLDSGYGALVNGDDECVCD